LFETQNKAELTGFALGSLFVGGGFFVCLFVCLFCFFMNTGNRAVSGKIHGYFLKDQNFDSAEFVTFINFKQLGF